MFIRRRERPSLLRYWTTRYLLTLCVGFLIIGGLSTVWVRYVTVEKRLDVMRLVSTEIAERVTDGAGNLQVGPFLHRLIEEREKFSEPRSRWIVFIFNDRGEVVFRHPEPPPGQEDHPPPAELPLPETLKSAEDGTTKIQRGIGDDLWLVKTRIESSRGTVGWVNMLSPERDVHRDAHELVPMGILLASMILLGWTAIYLLTRKLSKPILEVADAAKQIVAGNYDVRIEKNIREREVYDLVDSFREMAERLQQLEALRKELLAGAAHELKTPVTAIGGLIQAVKDGVVTGEEAQEFLEICAGETRRLQQMVEDLLDFHAFAAGAVAVRSERREVGRLVSEIVHQWLLVQGEQTVHVDVRVPDRPVQAAVDSLRVQQILINLLNNAKEAVGAGGRIEVILEERGDEIRIDVQDDGPGIPEDERPYIFEPFFRGRHKKRVVRGLGLGLPFSRLMARALGGDLVLSKSSPEGSVFTLILKK
ncbi:MAG: HAMP domain-containing sensor histidine kinase [Alicyclobacillaceae bacterium]|nr:HAMP domain-containing sensor histidine kinase [Alicyclobacillaceae bacterium]